MPRAPYSVVLVTFVLMTVIVAAALTAAVTVPMGMAMRRFCSVDR